MKQSDDYNYNWCTTYTSTGLTGNGRKDYDCWMKGTRSFMIVTIDFVHSDSLTKHLRLISFRQYYN